jgi:hypothetical protein
MNKFGQVALALLPLVLTPVLGYVLAEGVLSLGGGDKDIFWAFLWAIWSIAFAVSSIFLINRNWAVDKWALRSTLASTGVMLVLWLLAFAASVLGLA